MKLAAEVYESHFLSAARDFGDALNAAESSE